MSESVSQSVKKGGDEPRKLSFEEFAELPHWAQLGITARAVWRMLPRVFLHSIDESGFPLSVVEAEARLFLALLAARTDRAIARPYAPSEEYVSEISRSEKPVANWLITLCTAAAARIVPDSPRQLYRTLSESGEFMADDCGEAAKQDRARLVGVKPKDDAALRNPLVDWPLWPSEPPNWVLEQLLKWRDFHL